MSRRVLCAGHVNWDVTLCVDKLPSPDGEVSVRERAQAGGGSAANVAAALAGFGADVSLFGSVGSDEFGERAVEELTDAGVDASRVVRAEGETAVKYLIVDGRGEVMVLSDAGANEAFTGEEPPAEALAVDHLHLTSQRPEAAATLARRASEAGATVSFDPGRTFEELNYAATLRLTNVLFLNKQEAAALVNNGGFHELAPDAVIVITRGAGGAEVRTPDGSVVHPGFDIEPLDTTGAGDAFTAGFLAAVVDDDYERATAVGNACGALASQTIGARVDIDWDDVEAFLDGR